MFQKIKLKLIVSVFPPKYITESKVKSKLVELGIMHNVSRPDTDNYIKPILDAMNEIVYDDDGQIYSISCDKNYVNDGEQVTAVSIH